MSDNWGHHICPTDRPRGPLERRVRTRHSGSTRVGLALDRPKPSNARRRRVVVGSRRRTSTVGRRASSFTVVVVVPRETNARSVRTERVGGIASEDSFIHSTHSLPAPRAGRGRRRSADDARDEAVARRRPGVERGGEEVRARDARRETRGEAMRDARRGFGRDRPSRRGQSPRDRGVVGAEFRPTVPGWG